jgi:hypothetical protein
MDVTIDFMEDHSEKRSTLQNFEQDNVALTQNELEAAVVELTNLYNEKFQNSVIKKEGWPRRSYGEASDSIHFDGNPVIENSSILEYDPNELGYLMRGDEQLVRWVIDRSSEDQIKISLKPQGGSTEEIIFGIGDVRFVEYIESESVYIPLDPQDPDNSGFLDKRIKKRFKDTSQALAKGRDIIGSMPQVEKDM